MRVLIAFGSKMGGTEGLARQVGATLRQVGHEVDVREASELDGMQDWDAAVVGGALYAGRWKRSARRFVQRHLDELSRMPVWFFSSGPLDDSAREGDIAPTAQVRRLMERVRARGHVTFGGKLSADAQGFIAHAMAKHGRAGDFRDMQAVENWARKIATELSALPPRQAAAGRPSPMRHTLRRFVGASCLFTGLIAMGGGLQLIAWPLGSPWLPMLNVGILQETPFFDFFLPGLLLFFAVGVLNLLAGILALRRHRAGELMAFGGGGSVAIWLACKIGFLRTFSALQAGYLALGVFTMAIALWLFWGRRAAVRSHGAAAPGKQLAAPESSADQRHPEIVTEQPPALIS